MNLAPRGSCGWTSVQPQTSLPVLDDTSGEGPVSSPSWSSWGEHLPFHVCAALLTLETHQTFSRSVWSSGSAIPRLFGAVLVFAAIGVSRRQFAGVLSCPSGATPSCLPRTAAPAHGGRPRASPRCLKSKPPLLSSDLRGASEHQLSRPSKRTANGHSPPSL